MAQEAALEKIINVLTIGMPGHGKSTFNDMLTDTLPPPKEHFPTSARTESFTQEIKSFCHNHQGYSVRYIDTPGFPDTNKDKASVLLAWNFNLIALSLLGSC